MTYAIRLAVSSKSYQPEYGGDACSEHTSDEEKTTLNETPVGTAAKEDREAHCTSCGRDLHLNKNYQDINPEHIDDELNIVDWDGPNDPAKPTNWSMGKKLSVVFLTSLLTMMVTFGSSVFTATIYVTAKQFNVSSEVMLLGLALYILGFGLGPILWGPCSEVYGRTKPLWTGMFLFCIFQIPVAVAQNLQTIMICRYLQGVCGSAPLAILGGMYVDILPPIPMGLAASLFMATVFAGPCLGPVFGSLLVANPHLGWRWTSWITFIFGSMFLLIAVLFVPETYAPVLLRRKAERLRIKTKNFALHPKSEESPVRIGVFLEKYLIKPVNMIVKEPILLFVTIYIALVYGILYLSFSSYPISFELDRKWKPTIASLPFISLLIGILIANGIFAAYTVTWFAKRLAQRGKPYPEDRLPVMILGSLILPIGLFWFGWTSHPSTSWVSQCIASIFIGCGMMLIFISGVVYIIDVYLVNANSAIAINTVVRSVFGAGFPLFAPYMYRSLGVDWATSVLGFVCVALIPFPVLFWMYGPKIRSWSKFAFVLP